MSRLLTLRTGVRIFVALDVLIALALVWLIVSSDLIS